jgi:outer membrane protein assembly factor BamA
MRDAGIRPFSFHTCEGKSHPASLFLFYLQFFASGRGRALTAPMKYLWVGCLLVAGCPLFAGSQDSEFNVNTRYTVENILVAGDGWTTDLVSSNDNHISHSVRRDLAALIGQKLNPAALDELANRLRKEFRARTVNHHVMRGKTPDTLQIVFEIKLQPARFDLSVPKFAYNSNQGWNGAGEATATFNHNSFTGGVVSDGDDLLERYTGFVGRYENTHLGSDAVRFKFEFDSFHDTWDQQTVEAGGVLYRTRQNFEPVFTVAVSRPLTVSFGMSFERMQDEGPVPQVQAANAFIASAHLHRRLENDANLQDFDAAYDLRAGMHTIGSDFGYNRHHFQFRYTWTHGNQMVIDDARGGILTGQAPLYERFDLGNSSTLRGWNKFDLDPLGGNRVLSNSVEYRYGSFQAFFDSGAIWDRGEAVVARNSVGVGIREGPFSVAVAFPLKNGRVDPVLMVGMIY